MLAVMVCACRGKLLTIAVFAALNAFLAKYALVPQ